VTAAPAGRGRNDSADALETAIARLLVVGTWLAMALVLAGVLLLLASGVDPLTRRDVPSFDLTRIPADLVGLRPGGFLWAGIALIVTLPVGRVVVAGLGFLAARDGRLALVSILVLLVVIVSIAAALGLEG